MVSCGGIVVLVSWPATTSAVSWLGIAVAVVCDAITVAESCGGMTISVVWLAIVGCDPYEAINAVVG